MPNLFARAASLLLGEDPEDTGDRDVRLLLEPLGYAAAAEFPAVAGNPETFGLNLTRRHFAVPAARVIAPGLQPMPSEIITPRLADMIARTGTTYTDGVALI